MPDMKNVLHRPAAGVLATLALTGFGLTACGSSPSASHNAAATSSATASTSTTGSSSQPGGGVVRSAHPRIGAIRECLQRNGIALPQRPSGSGPPQGGSFFLGGGGGPALPKGVTRAQYETLLKKCGGGRFAGGGHFLRGGPAGVRNPMFTQALAKFAACLRQNGINVPAPNTSGKGPVFSTKGLNTASPQFRSATTKCRGTLLLAFRHARGAGGAPGK